MAYDRALVERVREHLGAIDGVTELQMFGGWGATIHGNMALGVMASDLIVRVGPQAYDAALQRTGARPFDFTGRAMTGWVYVNGSAVRHGRSLASWATRGIEFAESVPPKAAARRRTARR